MTNFFPHTSHRVWKDRSHCVSVLTTTPTRNTDSRTAHAARYLAVTVIPGGVLTASVTMSSSSACAITVQREMAMRTTAPWASIPQATLGVTHFHSGQPGLTTVCPIP